jgi:uncharacterized protein YbjT (DUF2867 family)
MDNNRVIAVVGATGAQGGGLVRAILDDTKGGFSVRALTRDVNSDEAKELAKAGAEVVAANVDDPQSLKNAFAGAYGVFCVTFFWEHFSPEKEQAQAKAMAEAAKDAGVKHVIWSTLEDTRKLVPLSDDRMPTLQDKYKVPHFDAKGEANNFFTDLGLPVTLLNTSFYWENFIYFGLGPKKGSDGKYALTFPMGDKKLPGICAGDIGKCAYTIFKSGEKYIGQTIGISGEHLTGSQISEALSEALGVEVSYNDVPADVFRSFGFPGADDMGNMFQFKRDFEEEFTAARKPEVARSLNPSLKNFKTWLSENKQLIPLND